MDLTADTRAFITAWTSLWYPPTHAIHVELRHRPVVEIRLGVEMVHVVHGEREIEHLEVGRVEEDIVCLLRR